MAFPQPSPSPQPISDRPTGAGGRNWLEHVREKCPKVKFIAHYALLGQYDFLDIYEAPDENTAAKVSIISQANGAYSAQSLQAIPYKDFLELIKEI